MPELPEVQTTVNGLQKHVIGLTITDIWSNYRSAFYIGSETIKDPAYFEYFRKLTIGKKIISVDRRAKNILIGLDNSQTILIHLKMTGHLLYGKYRFIPENKKDPWEPLEPEALKDPYNRHVRLVFTLLNNFRIALSDVRRFAKVAIIPTRAVGESSHLLGIGPEPLDPSFTLVRFIQRLNLGKGRRIKQVLTDQTIIAGIGNIYADESLWRAGLNPAKLVNEIGRIELRKLYVAIQNVLQHGIDLGGDSMSDYRNVHGEKGGFQEHHFAYRRTGKPCLKKGCKGTIVRTVIGGRGTHYCDTHQKLAKSIIKKRINGDSRSHSNVQ